MAVNHRVQGQQPEDEVCLRCHKSENCTISIIYPSRLWSNAHDRWHSNVPDWFTA